MQRRGLQPEVVDLPHGTEGYWLGNKDAKNVIIYYHGTSIILLGIDPHHFLSPILAMCACNPLAIHQTSMPKANLNPVQPTGGGFAMAAGASHFDFWLDLLQVVNENGHDIAVFFPRYTLTPHEVYPTQLRQAVGALRYILTDAGRAPSNVIVGGDSAGGNLAMAVLLHLSHPHPDIDPITLSGPLAGVFGYAPWINFSHDWPSFKENAYRDVITDQALGRWSNAYLDGKQGDSWSEPDRAPAEWWSDAKTERILLLAGGDEILLGPIESFAKKVKVCFKVSLNQILIWRDANALGSRLSRILRLLSGTMSLMMHICMSKRARRRGHRAAGSYGNGLLLDCELGYEGIRLGSS
jgi:acetyl esterase/lipase